MPLPTAAPRERFQQLIDELSVEFNILLSDQRADSAVQHNNPSKSRGILSSPCLPKPSLLTSGPRLSELLGESHSPRDASSDQTGQDATSRSTPAIAGPAASDMSSEADDLKLPNESRLYESSPNREVETSVGTHKAQAGERESTRSSTQTGERENRQEGSQYPGRNSAEVSVAQAVIERVRTPSHMRRQSNIEKQKTWTGRDKVIFLVENIPACVIVLNAITIGLSADISPDATVWRVFEFVWILCYASEFVAKMSLFGHRWYFRGPDRQWNWFDLMCLSLSVLELIFDYLITALAKPGGGLLGIMKMLRLARLARLLRALHFSIFDELKQMVLGVFAGVRVLFWAIVLLLFCIFFIGVMVHSLMGQETAELRTLPMSMLTVFRCFTEGCTAFDGTPLSARLFKRHGAAFFFGYILAFMFVTVGIFNLIMAIFIDNVVSRSLKRKLSDLGQSAARIETAIKETLAQLITEDENWPDIRMSAAISTSIGLTGSLALSHQDLVTTFDELADKNFSINRPTFGKWLEHPAMHNMLASADVDIVDEAELFDVLDVDMGGELELNELLVGLMTMRGPITKSDIVAVRLKVRYLVDLVDDVRTQLAALMMGSNTAESSSQLLRSNARRTGSSPGQQDRPSDLVLSSWQLAERMAEA